MMVMLSFTFNMSCHHFIFVTVMVIIWLCDVPKICYFYCISDRNVTKVLSTTDVHFQVRLWSDYLWFISGLIPLQYFTC